MEKLEIVFHETYLNYRFGPGHPLDPNRAKIFLEKLRKYQIDFELHRPQRAKDSDILLVHKPHYLQRLKKLADNQGFLSPDTPVTPENLESAYFSVGGTILTLKLALEKKKIINLSGGWHHAGTSSGSGFCLLNDHAVAIKKLQKERAIKKAMVFDLDVHAGQGTQEIFYFDPKVYTVSLHQDPKTLYPGVGFAHEIGKEAGRGYNRNIPLSPGTGEKEYLKALDKALDLTLEFKNDLLILILGVDTYEKDPLANLGLKKETYTKIGQRFSRFEKVAVLFAGGYTRETPDLWLEFLKGYL